MSIRDSHGVVERNRISSLQSHGKALEKECCLPGVFCDSGDTPANLLCELNGHLMPCTSCFYGKWVEDVCAGHEYYYSVVQGRLNQWAHWARAQGPRISFSFWGAPNWLWWSNFLKLITLLLMLLHDRTNTSSAYLVNLHTVVHGYCTGSVLLMGLLQLRFEHDSATTRYDTLRGFSCARIRDRIRESVVGVSCMLIDSSVHTAFAL